jgi:hypothetical protein
MIEKLPYGGSALDQDSADLITEALHKYSPKNILEFGSGTSTAIFANYAEQTGAKVTSLEHLEWAREKTLNLLGESSQYVDLRHAPIESPKSKAYQTTLTDNIDFVLIDGPPAYGGVDHIGREGTFPQVYPHLADSWHVFVDDANREHEKLCLELWINLLEIFNEHSYEYEYTHTNKGLLHIWGNKRT